MIYLDIDLTKKENFMVGMLVDIEIDNDIKRGYISKILSNSNQDKIIKVQLNTGDKGRIYGVPSKDGIKLEKFKFYNLFFNSDDIYTILKNNDIYTIEIDSKKYAYLYSCKEEAIKATKNTYLETKPYHINKLKRTKHIVELLKKYDIDIFIINMEKQLTNQELQDLEIEFKSF